MRRPRPGPQHLAVAPQDRAEPDVLGPARLGQPPGHAGGLEDHGQVLPLGQPDDVDEPGGLQVAQPMADGRQVGGGVAGTAVALADDEGQRLALAVGEPGWEEAQGAVALLQQAELLQLGDHVVQVVVVGALAGVVVGGEQHVELAVEPGDGALGGIHEGVPEAQRVLVAGLQQHDPLAAALGEDRIGVELGPGLPVEGLEVGEGELARGGRVARVDEVLEEHAEGGAPVAQVVLADDVVAEELQHAHDGVADDRRAEVADVHLLGHVGRGVVDDHHLGPGVGRHAEPVVGGHLQQQRAEEALRDHEVDEPRPGDLALLDGALERGCRAGQHVGGDVAGRTTEPLGQRQCAVSLVVGSVGTPHDGIGRFAGDGRERRLEQFGQDPDGISHRSAHDGRMSPAGPIPRVPDEPQSTSQRRRSS